MTYTHSITTEPPLLEGYMTVEQCADALGKTPRSLAHWRRTRQGPPYVKIGRTIMYRREAVLGWVAAQQVQPGDEPA